MDGPTVHFGYSGSNERTRLWFDNGDSEELLLTPIDGDLYRLEESSFVGEMRYADVIRASPRDRGGLLFLAIETRSNLVTQSWILSRTILESPGCTSLLNKIVAMGGAWERAFGGVLLVHTPQDLEGEVTDRIKDLMSQPSDSIATQHH